MIPAVSSGPNTPSSTNIHRYIHKNTEKPVKTLKTGKNKNINRKRRPKRENKENKERKPRQGSARRVGAKERREKGNGKQKICTSKHHVQQYIIYHHKRPHKPNRDMQSVLIQHLLRTAVLPKYNQHRKKKTHPSSSMRAPPPCP